ncbi:MAG: hypothetical protein JWL60_627 [Gemmatimonadetes bacterium]|nr:hypothetical protein [Gemmatimonadota bacterium]
MRLATLRSCALVAALLSGAPLAAQQVDVIRGQVTGPEGLPIERANVTATSVNGGVNRTARTDASGRFTITFPGGEGDYFVSFAALGYNPRRFEVKRTADQEILVADARLQRAATVLDTVRSVAARERVSRNASGADVGGSERTVNPATVASTDLGDLNAMAASIPGVTPVLDPNGDPAGWSVLGLSADQNSTTLNGASFGSSSIPRDANVATSVSTSPYDVSRGGFSGGQQNLRTGPGSNFIRRTNSLNLDQPTMQWTDRAARALGSEYSNYSVGGLLSGPIETDRSFYNLSYQLGRRTNDLRSLLNTDRLGLQTAGLSADSVSRLLGVLAAAQVPAIARNLGNSRVGEQGSVFGTIDLAPPSSTTGQTFNLTGNASWNRTTPATQLTTELPAHSGDMTRWTGGLQARHSAYVRSILTETTAGVNRGRSYGTPYLSLPNATVIVNSLFDDGTSGVRSVGFGGNGVLGASSTTTSADLMNQLSWFSTNNRHRIKLTTELRRESYDQDQTTNVLGTFGFNSIADVQAGRPAYYSRQLGQRVQAGSAYVAGLSLGDAYRHSPDLQIQYGVRVDANRFATGPAYNPDVARVFGRRTDEVPDRVYVSPRLGFSWAYGTAPQIASFEGAARGPRAVVRGGVGVFRNTPRANLVGSAVDNTGLPGAVQQLFCVGAAAPAPDWASYLADAATIPTRCADGSSGSVFSSTAPNVLLFSPDFAAERRVSGNLQWSGPVLANRFSLTVDGTIARTVNQPGIHDLNFVPAAQFTLGGEDGRPVYARPGSIVPGSGAIAAGEARRSAGYNRVVEQRSDLASEARQLRLSLSPSTFSTGFSWGLSYVLSNVREQSSGFSSTAGDPTTVAWSRSGFDSRHQVTYNVGYNFLDAVRVNWFGQFRSGAPFTPQVAGDVNGDGYATNDRAFVFDPAQAEDPALGTAMRALLASGAPEARACLARQLGEIASRMSCEGPWTSSATLGISFNPVKLRLPRRANLSFQLNNPLAAADLLLHGEGSLRGWGQSGFADPNLLYVRGFDPARNAYRYEVNSRFGNSSPQASFFRSPVTLTALLRIDVGPSRERQVLTQGLDRGRATPGDRAPEVLLRAQYGTGGITNPMAQLLRQSDTLGLTGPQADSLATLNRWYTIRLDSIWTPVTREWAALPTEYDQGEAYARYKRAREASVDLLISIVPRVNAVLTAEQRRSLPPFVASVLDVRYLASVRSGTAGQFGGPTFAPGGAASFGGDGNVRVIRIGP